AEDARDGPPSAGSPLPPAAPGQEELSRLNLPSRRVTLRFVNASVRDVIDAVAVAAGIRVQWALGNEERSPITIRFDNATVPEVLRVLMTSANVSYTVVDETTVRIASRTK